MPLSPMRRRSSTSSSGGERESTARWRAAATCGGTRSSPTSPGLLPRHRSKARRRISSRTRPGRPVARRARSTSQGGFLLSMRETAYQADLRPGDRVLFSTDMGWIMGPWTVVGGMACGATIVLMEGAPDRPPTAWRIVESERITMLGISPTLVRALIPHGKPVADLSSLRSVVTTGEPWNRGPYDWLDEHVCGKGSDPDRELLGGNRGRGVFPLGDPDAPDQGVLGRIPGTRRGRRRLRRSGSIGARRGRRARLQAALAGNDARDLGRSGAVPRNVLAAVPRSLDARRLGVDRRGRLLVPPRTLGRHAEHRRQADRPFRARVGGGRPSGVVEAAAVGIPHEVKGEVAWLYCVLAPGGEATEADVAAAVASRAREGVRAGPRHLRLRSPEDAKREDRPPRSAGARTRAGSGDLSTLENPEALEEIERAV